MLDISALLQFAEAQGASDVHVTAGCCPKMRIHGRLINTNFSRMTSADTLEVLLGIVSPAQRDRFEADGEIDVSVSIKGAGRYRMNAYKQRGSITLTFRIVDAVIPDVKQLMLPDGVLECVDKGRGLIIVSGPAGSGKSTVLAALVDRINETKEVNIISIEDPIEYLHQHKCALVNQREVGIDTPSLERGVKSAIKEDADVIHIGVLDDERVATQAFIAAQTGKLVLTSMYTQGVVATLNALIGLFPSAMQQQAREQLAMCLKAVVTRQLCFSQNGDSRLPIYGLLIVNNEIRDLIRAGRFHDVEKIMEGYGEAESEKVMFTMDQNLFELYSQGEISEAMAISLAQDSERLIEKIHTDSDI